MRADAPSLCHDFASHRHRRRESRMKNTPRIPWQFPPGERGAKQHATPIDQCVVGGDTGYRSLTRRAAPFRHTNELMPLAIERPTESACMLHTIVIPSPLFETYTSRLARVTHSVSTRCVCMHVSGGMGLSQKLTLDIRCQLFRVTSKMQQRILIHARHNFAQKIRRACDSPSRS